MQHPSPSIPAARTALVHDWLDTWRGGENVARGARRAVPAGRPLRAGRLPARGPARRALPASGRTTTFLQRLPVARTRFRNYLPLMPRAIESLDVGAYDLVRLQLARGREGRAHAPRPAARLLLLHADALRLGPSDQYLDVSGIGARPAGTARRGRCSPAARLGPADERARRPLRRHLRLHPRARSAAATTGTRR